ncbi:MAG: GFA family protein [Halioglobus sp.]
MITGKCECGAVKYTVDSEINDFSHCHCSQCRRLHGAAFASFAGVSRAAFRYECGEQDVKSYASSNSHGRIFCSHCGSNILVELESEPESLYLAMGAMEGNPPLPPGYHIYVGSKAPWHHISDNLPQYDTEPEE